MANRKKSGETFSDRIFVSAKPILPCSRPQSIVGEDEFNFCVRHGNRWGLISIITDCVRRFEVSVLTSNWYPQN